MGGWVGGAILFAFAFVLLIAYKKGLAAKPATYGEGTGA